MHQVQNRQLLKQEEHSSSFMTEEESSHKHENGNLSPSVKEESDDLDDNQSSFSNITSKSVQEERHVSSNDGKDPPVVPLQKRSGDGSSVPVKGNEQLSHLYEIPKEEPNDLHLSLKGEKNDLLGAQNFTKEVEEQKSTKSTNKHEKGVEILDDGHNWRKYGQKLVKGNEFVRSYYRCTFPNCPAKRQVERSYDWCETDIIYLGDHQHLKPEESSCDVLTAPTLNVAAGSNSDRGGENVQMEPKETLPRSVVTSSDSVVRIASQQDSIKETSTRSLVASSDSEIGPTSTPDSDNSKNVDRDPKRRKMNTNSDDKSMNKHANDDPRNTVQAFSTDDGYRWRKYGQKIVKGRPHPRSYYRCSDTSCPAKKQVERASHDPKVAVTTYEGQHTHVMPPPRT